MSRVKEYYLNNRTVERQEELTSVDSPEMDMLRAIVQNLEKAHSLGYINRKYMEYLVLHPLKAVTWLEDCFGVKII